MNLPFDTQLEPGKPRKILFRSSFIFISPIQIGDKEMMGVLLDKSEPVFRARCYVAIWRRIQLNDLLRKAIMGSADPVSLDQVRNSNGFGVVTIKSSSLIPEPGQVVQFTWHPWLNNRHLQTTGNHLGLLGVGQVVASRD